MIKDAAKMKKNGNTPGLKPPMAPKPSSKVLLKEVSAKTTTSAAREKDIKKEKADKKNLIKAAVAFSLLFLVIIFWFGSRSLRVADEAPLNKNVLDTAVTTVQTETEAVVDQKSEEGSIKKGGDKEAKTGPIISAVRITPSQPLPTDKIKAEAVLAGGDAEGISFSYRWKINGQFIPGAGTDTLADAALKRRDRISVVVAANRNGKEGPPTESQSLVVHSLPPSLEMKIMTDRLRPGDTAEIQLIGAAPDGDKVVFSLVSPFVEGMKIDEDSGKIIWTPKRVLQGNLQFGAAVADTDGNRTIKAFSLDLGVGATP